MGKRLVLSVHQLVDFLLRKGDIDIDHIIPQSYGGGHGADNLQCMCKHCNRSKKDSLRDVPFDYVRHNANRAKKSLDNFFD